MIIPLHAWSAQEVKKMVFYPQQLHRRRVQPPRGLRFVFTPRTQREVPGIRQRDGNGWNSAPPRVRLFWDDEVAAASQDAIRRTNPRRRDEGITEASVPVLLQGELASSVRSTSPGERIQGSDSEGEEGQAEQHADDDSSVGASGYGGGFHSVSSSIGASEEYSTASDDERDADGWDERHLDSWSPRDGEDALGVREVERESVPQGAEQVVGRVYGGGDSPVGRPGHEGPRPLPQDLGRQMAMFRGDQGFNGEATTCTLCGYIQLHNSGSVWGGSGYVCCNCETVQSGAASNQIQWLNYLDSSLRCGVALCTGRSPDPRAAAGTDLKRVRHFI